MWICYYYGVGDVESFFCKAHSPAINAGYLGKGNEECKTSLALFEIYPKLRFGCFPNIWVKTRKLGLYRCLNLISFTPKFKLIDGSFWVSGHCSIAIG